jgi:hypothetical protein
MLGLRPSMAGTSCTWLGVEQAKLGIDDSRRLSCPRRRPRRASLDRRWVKGVMMKWVQPPLLVAVAFSNVSEAGRLQHPKLKGDREGLQIVSFDVAQSGVSKRRFAACAQ